MSMSSSRREIRSPTSSIEVIAIARPWKSNRSSPEAVVVASRRYFLAIAAIAAGKSSPGEVSCCFVGTTHLCHLDKNPWPKSLDSEPFEPKLKGLESSSWREKEPTCKIPGKTMDFEEKQSVRTSTTVGHRSTSLLLVESNEYRQGSSFLDQRSYAQGQPADSMYTSWSFRRLLSRNSSQTKYYRALERREPRRLRKKSLTNQ
ncbi:hypothetical protein VTN49DRAFT_7727 [Thermomyces lanuginosus]|uniref:uncharacterized protein n=1 Tax=Thermomyces lanuginosus TaxID=5541 RepID=UPI003742E590